MIHELKIWSEYYGQILICNKNFEVRKNDRDFKVGDILILKEWLPNLQEYTGDYTRRTVTYILHGGQFGIEEGYCVMSIQ